MTLPYRSRIIVPDDKLDNYLLSEVHEVGKHKAAFLKKIGFDKSNKEILRTSLISICKYNDIIGSREIINKGVYYGRSYEIEGELVGPRGTAIVRIVCKILVGKRTPSLVTVKPCSIINKTT